MKLTDQQFAFTEAVALLILFAYELEYTLSFGDAWAREGHKDGSFHYKRLAVDFNLFKGGKWLKETEDHKPLGIFWESIGGTWGGRWGDGNHYSWGEGK